MLRRLARKVRRYWRVQRRRARWERRWEVESKRPDSDLSTEVPRELVEAVQSGWFAPPASVMDIGSGRGQISAWLAERGFHVLAADFSDQATKLAQLHFQHLRDRLEFQTLDICAHRPDRPRFDALIDRGCFHSIPRAMQARYASNVAAWAREGARFLLLSKAEDTEARLIEEVRQLFEPYFELTRTQPTVVTRATGPIPRIQKPGVAFWMVRRSSDPTELRDRGSPSGRRYPPGRA
jgi:2-polyprenyl-3-methyl-5-hydroxy-6-metoxy-1,4-benzoquinol methylase